ncbi:hypothetical protein Drorol1_Dr00008129 [Drosera rotundifolia]
MFGCGFFVDFEGAELGVEFVWFAAILRVGSKPDVLLGNSRLESCVRLVCFGVRARGLELVTPVFVLPLFGVQVRSLSWFELPLEGGFSRTIRRRQCHCSSFAYTRSSSFTHPSQLLDQSLTTQLTRQPSPETSKSPPPPEEKSGHPWPLPKHPSNPSTINPTNTNPSPQLTTQSAIHHQSTQPPHNQEPPIHSHHSNLDPFTHRPPPYTQSGWGGRRGDCEGKRAEEEKQRREGEGEFTEREGKSRNLGSRQREKKRIRREKERD